MPPSPDGRVNGLVRTTAGGTYEVELHQGDVVAAVLRGRLKRESRTGDAVVVGDHVEVERQEDGGWTIERVLPRRTELARRSPRGGGHRAKVLVANADQILAVFAVANPAPRLRMLDRFLVLAEANGLDAVVVANKADLQDRERADAAGVEATAARSTLALLERYREIGYPVVASSAATGAGIEEVRARLAGRVTVLAGPSGVGKSSLLNALEPGLGLRVGRVSDTVGKGRHTTVSSRLIPLEAGGYVADTPGIRELGLWGVEPAELDVLFPEFRPFLDDCRFRGSCSHTHEPGCAVVAAADAGSILPARLESYRTLLAGDDE